MFTGRRRSKMMSGMVEYSSCGYPYISVEKHGEEYSLYIADTLISLKAEIRSFKADNDMIIQSQEILSRAQ